MLLLQIDFPYNGPTGDEMAEGFKDLAYSIAKENGLIWKIWTENKETKEAGGVYMFENLPDLQRYLDMHTKRLESFGVTDIRAKIFGVNEKLSAITKAPL
ncbi:MAG: monooxygenase [Sulfurimonas sp.]|uniref:monooxygenase n=1 Tax=Sulfurimonas sp. TaxID=2022749 RepID=UPI0028CF9F70|nr:monooxygenase [Sulfurimonas sp.]MDT8338365.1 monooxygenase [Sulfurimonas sp.]